MKKIIVLLVLILLGVTILLYTIYSKRESSLSYEAFNNITKEIAENVIVNNYDNVTVLNPVATVYPGNPDNAWTNDKFDIINNNALQSKKISLLINNESYFTRVDMVYQPEIKDKYYLNINYLDHLEQALDESYKGKLHYYSAGFTTNGIVFEVLTFSAVDADRDLIIKNRDVISLIQEYLLENDY